MEKHYLVRGDGCVLDFTVYDDGDANAIDDESWARVWIEVPDDAPLNYPVNAQVTWTRGGMFLGLQDDETAAWAAMVVRRKNGNPNVRIEWLTDGGRDGVDAAFNSGAPGHDDVVRGQLTTR